MRTRFGLLFFVLGFISNVATQLIPVIILQRPLYYKQAKAGYFHGLAYYLSHVGVNVPQSVVEIFVFSSILYPMSGLRGNVFISESFWYFWLLCCIASINASMDTPGP
jgi:ABC-type multidrug transport system permease subunit